VPRLHGIQRQAAGHGNDGVRCYCIMRGKLARSTGDGRRAYTDTHYTGCTNSR